MNNILFMIHGMMVAPWCWKNYKHYFTEKNYRCITPTLRHHDMDPNDVPDPRLGETGLQDYITDLEKHIKDLDEPPILMGHSMGGLLVQILAAKGYARAAVLITPAPPRGVNALRFSVLRSFSGVMMNWGFWRRPFRFSFEKAVYSTMHLMPREDQKKIYGKLVYESGRAAFQIGFWFLDRTRASRVEYEKVNCPVLVIAGKKDRITPAEVVKNTAAKYPNSTYKQFDDHAHWVLMEPGWQDIADFIAGWLERNC